MSRRSSTGGGFRRPGRLPAAVLACAALLAGCSATAPPVGDTVFLCAGYLVSESRMADVGATDCTRVVHHSDAPACGARVAADDVSVIDPADPQQVDDTVAVDWSERDWVAVEGAGSRVANRRAAAQIAAALGCNRMLAGPFIPADRSGRGVSRFSFDSHQLVKLARAPDPPAAR